MESRWTGSAAGALEMPRKAPSLDKLVTFRLDYRPTTAVVVVTTKCACGLATLAVLRSFTHQHVYAEGECGTTTVVNGKAGRSA